MKKILIFTMAVLTLLVGVSAYLWQTKYSTAARLQTVVKANLNDPQSAVFGAFRPSKVDPNTWCGSVNSRNRMGGMTGETSVIVTLDNQRDKYGLPYIEDEHVLAEVIFNTAHTVDKFFAASQKHCWSKV